MTSAGVILYGPPGSGKDTVSAELARLRPAYELFQRLKAGPGRSTGYRLTTTEHIEDLERSGGLLYRNARYSAEYAIDRGEVSALLAAERIPILHMGQVSGVRAIEAFPVRWVKVLLWCSEEATLARCTDRGDKDVAARLKVWHETRQDLLDHMGDSWSLVLRTDEVSAAQAARSINKAVAVGVASQAHDILGLVR
ncbi:AAA family ATPase [Streptomyces sp. NPDC058667]|uniref:AAA family ATPase n=1 Tax=Streptomyces sp. NPDC058667 TaxID=3346588 RepID=UPI00366148C6